jgi:hypothetical protein
MGLAGRKRQNPMVIGSFEAFCMAMDRVQQRLRRVTAALDAAAIRYAVIGGNAVAVWVARMDPAATRTTVDVDLLVQQTDADRITHLMDSLGFARHDLRRMVLFVDPDEPSRRSGIHLVWAGQKVRPSYAHPAPQVGEAVRDPGGFWVLGLPALLRMKLTSLRDIDRVHVADMLGVGLIDERVRAALPPDLRARLEAIETAQRDDE